jgi:hypothetical protein
MPTDHTVCGVPYRLHEDGRIGLVDASGAESFMTSESMRSQIAKNWERFGPIMTKLAKEFKIPVAYIIGFTTIESGGDVNACAPCTKTYTDKAGVEHQWCSFAPNCAPAGHKQCCAYGLLGVIHANVVKWSGGKHSGQDLLGNPELAIRYGMMIFLDNWKRSGDILTAVKWYNGGKACQGGGVFQMGGQVGTNYVDKFVQACNTFVELGLAPSASASLGSSDGLLVFGSLAFVGWLLATRTGSGRSLVRRAARAF